MPRRRPNDSRKIQSSTLTPCHIVALIIVIAATLFFCCNPFDWMTMESERAVPESRVVKEHTAAVFPDSRQWQHWKDACDTEQFNSLRNSPKDYKKELETALDHLLSFGPRVSGGDNGTHKAHQMISQMASCETSKMHSLWEVEFDNFTEDTVIGKRNFSNIVASFKKGNRKRGHIVLAAHWDSKLFHDIHFVGACDSALPVVLLLALQREVSNWWLDTNNIGENEDRTKAWDNAPQLTIIFFDGEEAFIDWKGNDNTYGARHLAKVWYSKGMLKEISLFVLLDLIGPKSPVFHNYYAQQTGNFYLRLHEIEKQLRQQQKLLVAGKRLSYFPREGSFPYRSDDDHTPFLNLGVPILHLIPLPYPREWHTAEDNMSAIDFNTSYDILAILRTFLRERIGI